MEKETWFAQMLTTRMSNNENTAVVNALSVCLETQKL